MAELKTNTKIGTTTIAQGGTVTVTLPAATGTIATTDDITLIAIAMTIALS
jgi:hypothetical protein